MKRSLSVFLVLCMLVILTGCASTKVIDNVKYDTYGVLNMMDKKNPNIVYKPVWGNIIWGTALIPTIIAPIYFYGFSSFEPVCKKTEIIGQVG